MANSRKKKFKKTIEKKNATVEAQKHSYMLLSRYQMDLDYFFGNGRRSENVLYFGNFKKHIEETFKLWDSLIYKPEWLSKKDIENYQKRLETEAK